jgi:8-oxo-dGTP pyrophosphatase MutT (NUDIX family)
MLSIFPMDKIYTVYFNKRRIVFSNFKNENNEQFTVNKIICKNTKSFDIAYNEFANNSEIEELNCVCKSPGAIFSHFKTKFKVIKAAGGIVYNKNAEILIIKRMGYWDLPKGKIEKGESKISAAIREVSEECGIDHLEIVSKMGKTYHTYALGDQQILKLSYWYNMIYSGIKTPVPQTEEHITEAKWINKSEIDEILNNTYKNLYDLFQKIKMSNY